MKTLDEALEEEIAKLEARRSRLRKLVALQSEVADLEKKLTGYVQTCRQEFDLIIQKVCAVYGVTPELIRSRRRRSDDVLPRQLAMYLLRTLTEASLERIGAEMRRDHGTVCYAVKAIEDRRDTDRDFAEHLRILETGCREALARTACDSAPK